jgi:hypothetical protein
MKYIGENTIQLLSRDGDELATAELPRYPITQPIIGDFDNDGITDIIIITDGAILGYHVHIQQTNRIIFILLIILIFIAILVFATNIQMITYDDYNNIINTGSSATNSATTAAVFTNISSSTSSSPSVNNIPSHLTRGNKDVSKYYKLIRSTDEQHLD